jgi:Flp pilus assembly protein TadD
VGLDGADWELLDEYMARGVMPILAGLTRDGRAGILTTQHPPLSPLVWTTMMTGADPLEHGILDFTRFHPGTGAREPITSDERRVPAVWNMVTWSGKRVSVLGLWATWPAEPVNGLLVSDRLFSFQYRERAPPPGIVFPESRRKWAASVLDRAEREIGLAALQSYLPWLEGREYRALEAKSDSYAHPVTALRRILIETRVYHELARDAWAGERPDLGIVYIQGTDTIGHVFAPYAPPRQAGIQAEDFEHYSRVPDRYFAYVDGLLGEYRRWAQEAGAVLMIASDHGFHWKEGRPGPGTSLAAPTAGRWHRDEGIFLLWGPGVAPASRGRERSGVGQVCATLLALLGLPGGKGLIGPPLPGTPRTTEAIIDYRAFYHAPPAPRPETEPTASLEEIEKLRALGYIGTGETAGAPAHGSGPDATRTPGSWNNEGLILRERGRREDAARAFERAIALDPRQASALWNLSELLFAQGRDPSRSDQLLVRAAACGLSDGVKAVVGRAIARQRAKETSGSLALLDDAIAALPAEAELYLFRGRYRIDRRECEGALADFQQSVRLDARNASGWASSGVARLCLGDRGGAAKDFRRSLDLDPDQPQLVHALEQGP